MIRAIGSLTVCLAGLVYAQSSIAPFEVASIKPSNADPTTSSGIDTANGRINAHYVTLKRCIMGAYNVGPHEISGGPNWLDSDRYEILAKAAQPIHDDAVLMVMLQGLLAARFHLALHRETRTIPAFVLEVAKNGPKLEKADAGEARTNTSTSNTGVMIEALHTDLDAFARILARRVDLPVVNHTGLDGAFNIKLSWIPDSGRSRDAGALEGASIFTAIQEQLGLRLRSQKAPVEVLVIDHAEKPSEN